MTRRLASAFLLLLVASALVATCMVPRLHNGISTIPTPGKGYPSSYVGFREYGWPAVLITEQFTIKHPLGTPFETTYSALDHAMGRVDISVHDVERSVVSGATINFVFFSIVFVFATISLNAMFERKFSLRALFGIITCVAIATALLSYTWSLARPKPLWGLPRVDSPVWSTPSGG